MIKIDDHADTNLNQLASEYFDALNPLDANGHFDATRSLIGLMRTERIQDQNDNQPDWVAFWDYLLNNKFDNLKDIIKGRPEVLKDKILEINRLFGYNLFSNHRTYNSATFTIFGRRVSKVFNYETFYRKKPLYVTNCSHFRIRFCPYCNETPIPVISILDNLQGPARYQALHHTDHFYPQSRHPYLSLSFFNLIPGCAVCNSQLKGEKQFDIDTHFNPFHKRFDDHITFRLTNLLLSSENDVVIENININGHPNSAIIDFRIINRYNQTYKRQVMILVQGLKNHKSKIIFSMMMQLPFLFPDYNSARNRFLEQYGVPIEQRDINSFALGKLKRDICKQLGLMH